MTRQTDPPIPGTRVLAAAASANVNMTVAFQSFADMLSPDDKTLDGRAVLQSVLTNCQVKLIFGGTDAETAEWVATASGTVRKRVAKTERTKVGALGGETWEDQRTLGDAEEALIPENTVLSLPPGRAVLFQPGKLATVVQVSPIRTPEAEAVAAARAAAAGGGGAPMPTPAP
jgi:type IV secretory pathway TraG/TraD family ATPase VirD4